jgi:hypothetical protein
MSKNYIEEWLKDNDLSIDESFNVEEFTRNPYFIDEGYRLRSRKEPLLQISGDNLVMILTGEFKIEKIKPKTLMEQLNEQGYGWVLSSSGEINKAYYGWEFWGNCIRNGNLYPTQSEAEREVYRRRLEFEMQEWARENDCLGEKENETFLLFAGFLVHINRGEKTNEMYERFKEKTQKYYNWEE